MIFETGGTIDNYTKFDDNMFKLGNYFRTESEAQEALDKIKAIFNNNKKY